VHGVLDPRLEPDEHTMMAAAPDSPQAYRRPLPPPAALPLPEMHPSALSSRPSASAPFPPSPPRNHPQPVLREVCVECMMRDEDMADVDVQTPGVWDRDSDVEFWDTLRAEELEDRAGSSDEGIGRLMRGSAASSRESSSHERDRWARGKKRIGRGLPLTQASLRLWTSMVRSRVLELSKCSF
jgi:hypothetical protein